MNEETNENGLNCTNLGDNTNDLDIENAFSDLISKYFEEDTVTENTNTVEAGTVIDWDSVTNGQIQTINTDTTTENVNCTTQNDTVGTTNKVYGINIETTGINLENTTTNGGLYKNLQPTGTESGTGDNIVEVTRNAYGVITMDGDLYKETNTTEVQVNTTNTDTTTVTTTQTGNVVGTEFKLTQGNLPAKIGFWTKVRNFFIIDSKMPYKVEEPNQATGGIWNKLHNLFSFGKDR